MRPTKREFKLLANAGAIVSRERVLSGVWQATFDSGSNLVEVCARCLRRKPGDDEGAAIQTARGSGHRMPADRDG